VRHPEGRLDVRDDLGGHLVQAGSHGGGQPVEALLIPGRAAGLGHQEVSGAADAVGEHRRDAAVRVVAEGQLGRRGQAVRNGLEP